MGKPLRKVAIVGGATTPMKARHADKTCFEFEFGREVNRLKTCFPRSERCRCI